LGDERVPNGEDVVEEVSVSSKCFQTQSKGPTAQDQEAFATAVKQLNSTMEAFPNSGPMPGGYGQPASALPILSLDSGHVDEFDYSAFLDEQDLNYLAESSESMATPPSSSTPSSATLSDAPLQRLAPQLQQHLAPSTALAIRSPGSVAGRNISPEGQAQRRQRLERRGHTKSRRGCFNCKRRRIKVRRPGERERRICRD
jgi:hypothetical protein